MNVSFFRRASVTLLVTSSFVSLTSCGVDGLQPHEPSTSVRPSKIPSTDSLYPDEPALSDGDLPTYTLPGGKTISLTEIETVLSFGETATIVQESSTGNLLIWEVSVEKPLYKRRDLEALDDPSDSDDVHRILCFPATVTFLGSESKISDAALPRPKLSTARQDGYDGFEITGLPDDVCDVDEQRRLPATEKELAEGSTYEVAVAGFEKAVGDTGDHAVDNPIGVRFDYPLTIPGVSPHKDQPSSIYWGRIMPEHT